MISDALSIIWQYREGFAKGLCVTLKLTFIIWSVGLTAGAMLGVLSAKYQEVGVPVRVMSFVLSGMPILVFLFWLHYPAQALFGVVIDPFITAAVTFTIINIFAVCDLVRAAVKDFPDQYVIAARVSGLSQWQTIRHIQFPILLRQILPALLMSQVAMLHITLFASLISVEEIFRVAQRINASIYKPVEIYTALGIFFMAISLPVNGLAIWLKQRFTRNVSEQ